MFKDCPSRIASTFKPRGIETKTHFHRVWRIFSHQFHGQALREEWQRRVRPKKGGYLDAERINLGPLHGLAAGLGVCSGADPSGGCTRPSGAKILSFSKLCQLFISIARSFFSRHACMLRFVSAQQDRCSADPSTDSVSMTVQRNSCRI